MPLMDKKKIHPKIKSELHPRNRHRQRYDFQLLINSCPELKPFIFINKYNDESINFHDPAAVKILNKALLIHYYGIENWDIPDGYLCPPIPGRADYIHHIADLLGGHNKGIIPKGKNIKCLDIGVGANCVYPIIGIKEYAWSFIGSDIDSTAIDSAKKIINSNSSLQNNIELRFQGNSNDIFNGIIQANEFIDLTICNPPFHASKEEAEAGTMRKLKNLKKKKTDKSVLNFGGQHNELWCEGGEENFIHKMIHQSKEFANSCFWFSTLVSKKEHLKNIHSKLIKIKPSEIKTIPIGQGNKKSRILAWTFLNKSQQEKWIKTKCQ